MVIRDVANKSQRDSLVAELQKHMDNAKVRLDDDPLEFYRGHTQRVSGLVSRSETVREMMLHEEAISMCDHFLLPNSEFGYQLHVSAALNIGPGARAQVLHREEDSFTYFAEPRPNIILATMWAISDFRENNGATLVVPGSHTWPADRSPEPDEITSAEMPAGSVFLARRHAAWWRREYVVGLALWRHFNLLAGLGQARGKPVSERSKTGVG